MPRLPRLRPRAAALGALAAALPVAVGAAILRLRRARPAGAPVGPTPEPEPAPAAPPPSTPGLLDLNTASVQALQGLPGIGPARARRIVQSREADGPFASPEDLVARGLLPASVLHQIREAVVAGP